MLMMPAIILASGCTTPISETAVCDELRDSLMALTDVVLQDGSDAIVVATEVVVVKYRAGCQ